MSSILTPKNDLWLFTVLVSGAIAQYIYIYIKHIYIYISCSSDTGGSQNEDPQNRGFQYQNGLIVDDLGVPPCSETFT